MKYLNKSLQEAYSKLWCKFGNEVFRFKEAANILEREKSAVLNILSLLKRKGWIAVIGRKGKERIYKLVEPNDAVFALSELKNLENIQTRYAPLIIKACRLLFERLGENLISIVLYGSVARGNATPFSDIDLLIVADNLGNSLGERLDYLYKLIEETENEIKILRMHNIFANISLFPLSRKEAKRFIPLYLDISQEGIIIFDTGEFFAKLMNRLRSIMEMAGVKKRYFGKQWYWEMNPKKEFQVIAIES